jgi:outer membrane protein assembly factor BamB
MAPILSATTVTGQKTTNSIIWEYDLNDGAGSSPTVKNNTVYIGTHDGTLFAIDADTGNKEWEFDEPGDEIVSSPAVVDGTVYFGSLDGTLYAVNTTDGTEAWNTPFDEPENEINSSPTVVEDTVYFGSRDGALYAVNADTGTEEWKYDEPEDRVFSSPLVVDNTIYVGSDDGNVYAVDTGGIEEWTFEEPAGRVRSTPTYANGTLYVGSSDESLYAIDAESGDIEWEFTAPSDRVFSSPTAWNGIVYVGSYDRTLYAVDAQTGEQLWAFTQPSQSVISSPTVADGTVYVGSRDGSMYGVDAITGQKQLELSRPSEAVNSSPVVHDGTLYVASHDGRLYALEEEIAGSSNGTRIETGALGHHVDWTGQMLPAGFPGDFQQNLIQGTIYDVSETPLADAAVELYDADADADALVAETTTAADGSYGISDIGDNNGELPTNILFVAQKDDWFNTREIPDIESRIPLQHDDTLTQEKLFGPVVEDEVCILTCWRRVITPEIQTVLFEVVDLSGNDPRYIIDSSDINSGNFALTVLADDIWINFGRQSDVEGTDPKGVETHGVSTRPDNTNLFDWHPVRSELPLYNLFRYGGIDANFQQLSTTAAENADMIDEGVGIILGTIPGVATLVAWIDALQFAFGQSLETEVTIGDGTAEYADPNDPASSVDVKNPNLHTSAKLAWKSGNGTLGLDESAVTMAVPIEFQYSEERTTTITAEGEWIHSGIIGASTHVSFAKSFDIGPIGGAEPSTEGT